MLAQHTQWTKPSPRPLIKDLELMPIAQAGMVMHTSNLRLKVEVGGSLRIQDQS